MSLFKDASTLSVEFKLSSLMPINPTKLLLLITLTRGILIYPQVYGHITVSYQTLCGSLLNWSKYRSLTVKHLNPTFQIQLKIRFPNVEYFYSGYTFMAVLFTHLV